MRTLVVVPCGSSKVWAKRSDAGAVPAKDAYIGGPFVMNRRYAERFGDEWVILSAKYGFLAPDDLIPGPYEVTFKRKRTNPIGFDALRRQEGERSLGAFDVVIGLGGAEYRAAIEAAFADKGLELRFPFAGLPLGLSLQATKRAIDES